MSNLEIDADGNKYWVNSQKQLHRIDGPACEFTTGNKFWYIENILHRSDGPAREFVSGVKEWWVDGRLHRLDNPAIEWDDGSKWWYVDGKEVTESEYPKAVLLYKCKQVLES